MADGNPNRTTYWFNIERIEQLERALVCSAFAQHRTSAYQLPDRVQLIDGDCVRVTLADGTVVEARLPQNGGENNGR